MACNKLNRIWRETRKPKNKKKGEKMKQKRKTRTLLRVCVDLENCEQRHKKREKCISSRGTVRELERRRGGRGELGTEVDVGEWKVKNLKGHKLINH